ncbi:hypothetical protein RBSWK_01425 [Rhodopirellula baltica SWK14]|uniref:Uncharacterized protein n=1 Tax=Rhodopirellula baltica SWK14 TaxID=993516 RepID=L7CKX9_RHOBT|nr:hypothetical protein RBSWK_01425 [Rhodopirellula baltica SWK14]
MQRDAASLNGKLMSANFLTRDPHGSGQSASNLNAPPEGKTTALPAEAIENLQL